MKIDSNLKKQYKENALRLLREGKLTEAKSQFKQICELGMADAEDWHMLGVINGQLGNIEEAEIACRQAILINPKLAQAHSDLGNALSYKGKLDEAVNCYREALRLQPENIVALNNLGNVLNTLKRLEEAVEVYERALRLRPAALTYYNYGNVLMHQSRLDEAVEKFQKAVQLNPRFDEAYNNLGIACRTTNPEKAIFNFRKAVTIRQDKAEYYANLGAVLMELGQLDEALKNYQSALDIEPKNVRSLTGMVRVNIARGDFERANAQLQPILDSGLEKSDVALAFAALCRWSGRCDDAIKMMERILENSSSSTEIHELISLHFELGRLLDASGEYDRAFKQYRAGNELKDRHFDLKEYNRYIENIVQTYNADFLTKAPRAANESQRPIFIVGVPRSGTSLIEQILASHPQVYGAGELNLINQMATTVLEKLIAERSNPGSGSALTQETCDMLSQRYLERLTELSRDAQRVTDKMPANYLHLGLINLLFPRAQVIHCIRNPLDTCLSCYFQNFSITNFYANDLKNLGGYYRQYQRLMRHWEEVLDIAIMKVSYEDLVADLEGVSRTMLEFCGLSWDERCLEFYNTKRVVATASQDQVRQPLYQRSVGRWKNYERHLDSLKEALADG